MSPLLKLTIVLRRAIRGTPPLHRWVLEPPFSELREPIWIIFDVLKSRQVVAIDLIFFMGFVTAWSLDPERFRQKLLIFGRKKKRFSTIFCSDFLVGLG